MSYLFRAVGEVCSKVITGGTPLTSITEYYIPAEIPWLKTKEVNFRRIYSTEHAISMKGIAESSAKIVPPNSIIVAMYGQGDTAGRVAINKIPLATNQACCNLIINEDYADYRYIYYAIKNSYKKLVAMKNGGAQPNLNTSLVKSVQIPLPEIDYQRRIADILSAYDDLIENNQRQIKLLEEAVMRLYKEWFVKHRFPGYEVTPMVDGLPEGWERKNIDDLVTFHRGYDLTKNDMKIGMYPVIGSTSVIGYHDEYKIGGPGIVTGRSGSLGQYQLVWDNFWPHNTTLYISDYKSHNVYYIYSLLLTVDFSILNNGGAIPTLNRNNLSNISIVEPRNEIQELFSNYVEPIYIKKKNLDRQIQLLIQARDKLLPKLLNEEIEV